MCLKSLRFVPAFQKAGTRRSEIVVFNGLTRRPAWISKSRRNAVGAPCLLRFLVTLSLLDYQKGHLSLSGQHEDMIVVRQGGRVEWVDTMDLGFPIGLEPDIAVFVSQAQVQLHPGDVVVLYTDGITEAEDINGVHYGLNRLCEVVSLSWQQSSSEIKQAVIDDVRRHIGKQRVYNDITLVVLKQK